MTALVSIGDQTAEALQAALEEVPEVLSTDRLAEHIRDAVPTLPDDESLETLEALLSLMTLLPEDGEGVANLARDVADSPDLELTDEERQTFFERLEPLLELDSLTLAARAFDIVSEHDRVFHDARIVNDLRPVFGPDPADGPKAALLVATLKIDYHVTGSPLDSAYFALDQTDLRRLRDVVDRALAKHASLRGLVESMNLPYWEYDEPLDAPGD